MSIAPAGWHPDPSNPAGALRWWDGSAWTAHTHPAVAAPPPAAQYGAPPPAAQYGAPPPAWAAGHSGVATGYAPVRQAQQQLSFAKRNSLSLTAAGVVGLYVVLALTTGIVFLGIFPVILSVRAIGRKEPLAPAAVVAAIAAIAVAFLALK
jgi:Protein of unknown function (DUF2510)